MTELRSVLLVLVLGSPAFAQAPEDEWGHYPGQPTPPSQSGPSQAFEQPAALLRPTPSRPSPSPPPAPQVLAPEHPVEAPNRVSMLGAPPLGPGKRGQLFLLGFPLLSARAAFGLTRWLDLGLGLDSFYGTMNEPRLTFRFGLWADEDWSLSATLEGGYAFFSQTASRENRGARWVTGRRNVNLSPALVLSYGGGSRRRARIFFEARYLLAIDTEPVATDPLGGVPPAVVLGHNAGLRGGAELPLSETTAFVFQLGLDLHGRNVDSTALPTCSVGLVTGL
jgi:hypothetical protein